jgi:hypothetical protein
VADADPSLIQRASPVTIQVKFARVSIAVISMTTWSILVSLGNSPPATA